MIFICVQKALSGSQATLTSHKALSHHTGSEFMDDERSIGGGDEVIKDCNGRIIPRLVLNPVCPEEVSLWPYLLVYIIRLKVHRSEWG